MENLIIGVLASLVIFIVFFIVFTIRSRRIETMGGGAGCGHAGGQCRCRPAETSIQPFPPPAAVDDRKPCPKATGPKDAPKK